MIHFCWQNNPDKVAKIWIDKNLNSSSFCFLGDSAKTDFFFYHDI